MSFFHVYAEVPGAEMLSLRATAPTRRDAIAAATAITRGRPLPEGTVSSRDLTGIVTGIPVWVRNVEGSSLTVMITEHSSEEAALTARNLVPPGTGGGEAAL